MLSKPTIENGAILFLDYVGKGFWALSKDKEMSFPRVEVCANPMRLLQMCRNCEVYLSEAAVFLLDHDLKNLEWFDFVKKQDKYPHPECNSR